MAEIIRCDGGCGLESLDPVTRLHEANHWIRVRYDKNMDFSERYKANDKLFCGRCFSRVEAAMRPVVKHPA